MAKKQTTIIQEETVAPDNTPTVVAYRVGEVEKAVAEGFKAVHLKLDSMRDGFISHDQLAEAIKVAEDQHNQINTRMSRELEAAAEARDSISARVTKLEKWNDKIVWLVIASVVIAVLGLVLRSNFVRS